MLDRNNINPTVTAHSHHSRMNFKNIGVRVWRGRGGGGKGGGGGGGGGREGGT